MNSTSLILYFVVLAVAFYLLIIRPQQQRQKQQRELIAAIKPGDRVLTASGLFGTVVALDGDKVTLRLAEGVEVEMVAQAMTQIVTQTPELPQPPSEDADE